MKVFIIIFGLAALAFAQEEDPLKYFPYKTGDMWEYIIYYFLIHSRTLILKIPLMLKEIFT